MRKQHRATFYLITKGPDPTLTANYHIYIKTGSATSFVPFSGSSADSDSNTTYSTIKKAMTDIRAAVSSSSATLYFAEKGINLSNVSDGGATGTLDIGGASVELGANGTYTINGSLTSSNDVGTISIDGASLIVNGDSTSVKNIGTYGNAINNDGGSNVNVNGGTVQAEGDGGKAILIDGTGTVNISGGKIYSIQDSAISSLTVGTVIISGAGME